MQKGQKKEDVVGIRELFASYGEQYISNHKLTGRKKGLIRLLASCGTHFLGSHSTCCTKCNHVEISYNTCRNRHCPRCQQKDKLEWTSKRMEELLPVGYYHIVFTLPHSLNGLCLQNKKVMYGLLFKAASQTLLELAADPKHAGAKAGLTCVLHTWGQALSDHIHLHCMMPAGGLTPDREQWLNFDRKNGFFVYYKVVSRLFRKKFLAILKQAFDNQELNFHGSIQYLKAIHKFTNLQKKLSQMDWVVNIQPPIGNPEKILEYLSRYVFRIAISNNRIKCIKDGKLHFTMKDYKTGRFKPMKLDIDEFIRRFLMHVLPERFLKVRHYGLFTNRYRKKNIQKAKELLKQQNHEAYHEALEDGGTVWLKQDTVWDEIKQLINSLKIPNCPVCKKGRMRFGQVIKPDIDFETG